MSVSLSCIVKMRTSVLGSRAQNLAGCLDAVNQRQRVVEHSNIRLSFDRLANGVFAVCDLGNDLPAGLRFEHSTQSRHEPPRGHRQ